MIPAQQAKQIEEKKHSPKKDKNNPEVFSRQEKNFQMFLSPLENEDSNKTWVKAPFHGFWPGQTFRGVSTAAVW